MFGLIFNLNVVIEMKSLGAPSRARQSSQDDGVLQAHPNLHSQNSSEQEFFFQNKVAFCLSFFKKSFKKKTWFLFGEGTLWSSPNSLWSENRGVILDSCTLFPPENQGAELGEKFISWNRRPRDTREQNGTKMELERSWGANQRHWMEKRCLISADEEAQTARQKEKIQEALMGCWKCRCQPRLES